MDSYKAVGKGVFPLIVNKRNGDLSEPKSRLMDSLSPTVLLTFTQLQLPAFLRFLASFFNTGWLLHLLLLIYFFAA